jgi:hypothetical protein
MSHPAFTSVVVASSDLGDDLAEAFGVLTVAAIVGDILGSRLEDVAGIPWLSRVALPDSVDTGREGLDTPPIRRSAITDVRLTGRGAMEVGRDRFWTIR